MCGDNDRRIAVYGQGLYFYFDRKKQVPVLNGANIAVAQGAIYSLLGPSGCGKTTLLKCIIGQHKIQKGSLKVYGRIPGSKGFPIPGRGVGYMPQELGLYFEMSIDEILTYFGALYGMGRQPIKERISFLIDLLSLPEKKRIIKHLSGGQQRRVSFAIALLHEPPLIILDEPTVGVDPLLRQTIWDHLVALTKKDHRTVIITTHYTEEARHGDTVGLMRNGHLLVESSPQDLIRQHGVNTLEEVFLKLCRNSGTEDNDNETDVVPTSVESQNPMNRTVLMGKGHTEQQTVGEHLDRNRQDFRQIPMDPLKCDATIDDKNGGPDNSTTLLLPSSLPKEFYYSGVHSELLASFLRFIYITRKNFLNFKRNIFMISFSLLIPTIQMIVFCVAFGSDPFDLNVSIVNMDEGVNRYGERFLRSLNNRTLNQVTFDNFSAAYESVKRGESWAALHIGSEFSTCIVDRILEGPDSSNETLMCSMVDLYLDSSNKVISTQIYSVLLQSYMEFARESLEKFQKNTLLAESPVRIRDFVYGSESTTVFEFMAPALLVSIVYVISMGLTALFVMEERKLGIFERTLVTGATHLEVMMSLFFVLLTIMLVGIVGLITCTFLPFGIPCNGSLFWVAISILLVAICGIAYGFFISATTDDVATAVIVVVGSFFPTLALNGVLWPVEGMPRFLRYLAYSLPLTKIIDSVRSVVVRGWSFSDYNVWEGYLICSCWTIAFMTLCLIMFKHKK